MKIMTALVAGLMMVTSAGADTSSRFNAPAAKVYSVAKEIADDYNGKKPKHHVTSSSDEMLSFRFNTQLANYSGKGTVRVIPDEREGTCTLEIDITFFSWTGSVDPRFAKDEEKLFIRKVTDKLQEASK